MASVVTPQPDRSHPAPASAVRFRLRSGRFVAYAEYGEPHGLPVLYCHASPSSRLDIAFAAETLKQSGVRLLAIDRPGIGQSDLQLDRQLAEWPHDVAELIDGLGISRCAVLGWSAGGPYALACAHRLNRRVARVAIVGSLAPLESAAMIDEMGSAADRRLFRWSVQNPRLAAHSLKLARQLPRGVLRAALLRELKSPSDREIVSQLSAYDATEMLYEALRHDVRGVVEDYRVLTNPWDFSLDGIAAEVSIWHGAEDTVVPLSHAHRLTARLPNARLIILPGRGHFLLHRELEHVLAALRHR